MVVSFLKFGFGYFIEEDETIFRVFRTPFLFIIPRLVFSALFWGALAYGVWYFYRSYSLESVSGMVTTYNLSFLWGGLVLLMLYKVIGSLGFWYYNGIIMTNESLVFVDWKKLFHRNFSRIDFHNLDEIEIEKKGLKSFFMNYGTLRFQKVNGGGEIVVPCMNRPLWVSRTIEKYREEILDSKNFTEESALKHLLSQMVQQHVGINGQPSRKGEDYELLQEDFYEIAGKQKKIMKPKPPQKKTSFGSFFKRGKKSTKAEPSIEVEKELDDTGGIDIDLGR